MLRGAPSRPAVADPAGLSYPMVAPSYAATRSTLAKSIGLGRKPAAAAEPVVAKLPARLILASRTARQTLSDWGSVRKPRGWGFPHMQAGYMRVSTEGDRQVLDLQRDALLAPASMSDICLRIGSAAAGMIGPVWARRLPSSGPATASWSGNLIGSAGRCRIC